MRTLYECEVGSTELYEALEEATRSASLSEDLAAYSKSLVQGIADHQDELDEALSKLLVKYDLMRLAALDRNILRIGAYEIAYVGFVPPRVSINEAIEIAKKYSTAESGRFINGVLGKFMETGRHAEPENEPEAIAEEEAAELEEVLIEEMSVEEGSAEAIAAEKFGAWKLREEAAVAEIVTLEAGP